MSALKYGLIKSRRVLIAASLFVVTGCTTAPPKPLPPVSTKKSYKDAFAQLEAYVRKCLPGSRIRANLYTDIPEGELVVDEIPSAGFAAYNYTFAKEVLNIHVTGRDKQTEISYKNELSQRLVAGALSDEPCRK